MKMNYLNRIMLFFFLGLIACAPKGEVKSDSNLTEEIKKEFVRTWEAYKTYAWGHDVLLPISKSYSDWYEESLHISPIDAYSTMKVMGLDDLAKEVETFVIDSISWDKDLFVKTFEVNIRILGGLLSMYQYTGDERILEKTEDFGKRMIKAFDSPTGIPYYSVNLQTGEAKGNRVNVAEAGTYLLEMGILSYYTTDPVFYQAAKKANLALWERVSDLNLVGEVIDVETGEWVNENSHICAGIDSYYEYLYKSQLLFNDPDLKKIWENSIAAIQHYIADESDSTLWYCRVNMHTGEKTSRVVTLYDAFFPSILALSGDLGRAEKNLDTWNGLWNKYGLEPMIYDYSTEESNFPRYDLNPEIIESTYYLYHITGKNKYYERVAGYWEDIRKYCKTDVAYASVEDVRTMEKRDYMPTFFFAETLKYLYLTFTEGEGSFNLDEYVFNTEAHPFKKASFDPELVAERLGL
jgi:hypothetical protein